MGADAYRDKDATLRRETLDVGTGTITVADIGTVRVQAEFDGFETEIAPFIEAEGLAFEVGVDPEADIRVGDFLVIGGAEYQVARVERPTWPRGVARARVVKREVPA